MEDEAVAAMDIVGQSTSDHPPPVKKLKKSKGKAVVHGTAEPVEVTALEQEREHERGKPGPRSRPSVGSVFSIRNRDRHVASEASPSDVSVVECQAEDSLQQIKVEGAPPIGWTRHHQEIAEVPPGIIRAPAPALDDSTQHPEAVYIPPAPQGAPTSRYYGYPPAAATPQQHAPPPKMQPRLRVDTAGILPANASVAPSPAGHYVPHSGISAPSAPPSAETWSYHAPQYGLPHTTAGPAVFDAGPIRDAGRHGPEF
jgi:hypothetical protein